MSQAIPSTECLNCHAALYGPYCAACGQKAQAPNPRLPDLLHEYTHELLHVDGRLWRTIGLLFARPGWLTREYCTGRRASYLSPLRLYLILTVLSLTASALIPSHVTVAQDARRGQVVHAGGVTVSGAGIVSRLTPAQIEERIRSAQHVWVPRLTLALVPLWALLVMMVTRRARRHYPEHLVFSVHVHAALAGGMVLVNLVRIAHLQILDDIAIIVVVVAFFGYQALAMRTVYGGGWVRNLARSFTVTSIQVVTLFVATLTLLALVLLT